MGDNPGQVCVFLSVPLQKANLDFSVTNGTAKVTFVPTRTAVGD